jgi:hypothetical protein
VKLYFIHNLSAVMWSTAANETNMGKVNFWGGLFGLCMYVCHPMAEAGAYMI